MGNKPHHTGSIGGGINLSKSKTPHDADIKYMPVDDRAASPLHQAGSDSSYGIDGYVTNRKDLKQARKKYKIKHLSKEHKNLKDTYDMGQKVNEKKLFRVEDKLERKSRRYEKQYGESPFPFIKDTKKEKAVAKTVANMLPFTTGKSPASLVSSTTPKKSIKKQIGKAARAVEAKAPGIVQKYFNTLRKKQ